MQQWSAFICFPEPTSEVVVLFTNVTGEHSGSHTQNISILKPRSLVPLIAVGSRINNDITHLQHIPFLMGRTISTLSVPSTGGDEHQPLKRQEKMHLKMSSAEVVICK